MKNLPPLESIEAAAVRVEQGSRSFAEALRLLLKLVEPLHGKYLINVGYDGPTCLTVDILRPEGGEAGISVEADFTDITPSVYLLLDEENGDKGVYPVDGGNALSKAMESILSHLESK
jgi:hypothetical protein